MRTLSEEGLKQADAVAERHHVSRDVVVALLHALERGNGVQAQFSHPELGGLGQWSRGGMIMVGDMFNNALKARVDALCTELSELLHAHAMFKPSPRGGVRSGASSQSQSQSSSVNDPSSDSHSWPEMAFASGWWPEECGTPSSSGSQNDMRYACFPQTRRVAIQRGGIVRVYDSGDRRITGVSQQQSGSNDLTFTSQHGTVRLDELSPVSEDRAPHAAEVAEMPEQARPQAADRGPRSPAPPPPPHRPASPPERQAFAEHDIFAKIERLHELALRGVISDEEFAEKKKELLARI